ncbi:MAG: CopG family transcriptional regulator [Thermoplasmata archaeon]|nr:CopG family transcriptional regulator [Thermoplasmata archaeon]
MSEEKATFQEFVIKLPSAVTERIRADIEGTSFKGVEDFITQLVLGKYPELRKPDYTEEEEKLIKARLRKLGYIE